MPSINIHPFFDGFFSPIDVLASTATITIQMNNLPDVQTFFTTDRDLIFASDNKFSFYIGIKENTLLFERNGFVVKLPLNSLPIPLPNRVTTCFLWSYTEIKIICAYGNGFLIEKATETTPLVVPNSIIKWARKQSLLPIEIYETEEDFRRKMHEILEGVQIKIDEIGNKDIFWDIEYDSKKIKSKSPKREVNIQPILQAMLSDASLLANIEVIAEYNTSVGNLDFLFIGSIKGGERVYFCVEVKNAHSKKVDDGLFKQLPAYMSNKGGTYGAYCILDYREKGFEDPKPVNGFNLDINLHSKLSSSRNPILINKVRIIFYTLGRKESASKL
ncbi:hypothetical protein Fleli_3109 [Bernardetia litoralis DSM 6794]|uniref:Uncharacterized protein n=1 Tax=Bernardetia litoralis (strain ATCC 23117 / DSM 6794 / NBRC 15988 / NCIMB 1366 / Fx l1 / Sio-4) TaxID=880071 RepID=I4ANB4_BERLS|nr:hypothetical protein [Bernardetia litoralis]AFM05449.1 hypothetical protein Fleli_3109 [Bernardetia litoralis DSM 6794]